MVTEQEVQNPVVAITEKVRFLLVKKGSWGSYKTVRSSSVTIKLIEDPTDDFFPPETKEPKTDPTWVSISKSLISSKKFNLIWQEDDKLSVRLDYLSVPSPLRGTRLIPVGNLVEADKLLSAHIPVRQKLVEDWLESGDYPKEIEAAKERLGPLFKIEDYPTIDTLRSKFSFSWSWFRIGNDTGLETVNREIFLREQEKTEKQWMEVGEEISRMQRVMMQELVGSLAEKLIPGADGRPKTLRATAFNAIKDFLCQFQVKNITDDKETEKLVDRVKKLTEGIDVETVKTSDVLRDSLQKNFSEIKENLDVLVSTSPVRKVRF